MYLDPNLVLFQFWLITIFSYNIIITVISKITEAKFWKFCMTCQQNVRKTCFACETGKYVNAHCSNSGVSMTNNLETMELMQWNWVFFVNFTIYNSKFNANYSDISQRYLLCGWLTKTVTCMRYFYQYCLNYVDDTAASMVNCGISIRYGMLGDTIVYH